MAIDFPASPVNGQTLASAGAVWTYNSTQNSWYSENDGTRSNVVNTLVKRDSNGDFAARYVEAEGGIVLGSAGSGTEIDYSSGDINMVTPAGKYVNGSFVGSFSGSGASVTSLNASNLSTGTVAVARGGTGASTAALARPNLKIYEYRGSVTCSSVGEFTLTYTDAATLNWGAQSTSPTVCINVQNSGNAHKFATINTASTTAITATLFTGSSGSAPAFENGQTRTVHIIAIFP